MRPIISYRQFSITWNPLAESSYKTFNQFCEQHNLPAVLFLKYERQSIPKDDSARDVIVFKQNKMVSTYREFISSSPSYRTYITVNIILHNIHDGHERTLQGGSVSHNLYYTVVSQVSTHGCVKVTCNFGLHGHLPGIYNFHTFV